MWTGRSQEGHEGLTRPCLITPLFCRVYARPWPSFHKEWSFRNGWNTKGCYHCRGRGLWHPGMAAKTYQIRRHLQTVRTSGKGTGHPRKNGGGGAKQRKARRAHCLKESSDSSSTSSESSDENSTHRDGNYWKRGSSILGLPSWISRCREAGTPSAGSMGGYGGGNGEPPFTGCEILKTPPPPGALVMQG